MISPFDDGELIGCGKLGLGKTAADPPGNIDNSAVASGPILNFPTFGRSDSVSKRTDRNHRGSEPEVGGKQQDRFDPQDDCGDETVSFCDSMFVENWCGKPATVEQKIPLRSSTEIKAKDAGLRKECLSHVDNNTGMPSTPSLPSASHAKEGVVIPIDELDQIGNTTLLRRGEIADDKIKKGTDVATKTNQPIDAPQDRVITLSQSQLQKEHTNVLSLLAKNQANAIVQQGEDNDSDDDVIAIDGPDLFDMQRNELNNLQIHDILQKWPATFGCLDQDVTVQHALFIYKHKQTYLPTFLVALRAISLSVPPPDGQVVHLRNYLLEASHCD